MPVMAFAPDESPMPDDELATVTRALAHPARIAIIRLLAAQSECRGSDLFAGLPLAQSTISEHLRVLREAGLVTSHAVGTGMVYCLVPSVLARMADTVAAIAACTDSCDIAATAGRASDD